MKTNPLPTIKNGSFEEGVIALLNQHLELIESLQSRVDDLEAEVAYSGR